MAQRKQDLLSKLADRGEDVVGKLADMPAAQRLFDAAGGLTKRVDELQKRIRGLDALEERVTALERKVDRLSKGSGTARTTKRTTTKRSTRAKPSS